MYGLETWALVEATDKKVEGSHMDFLRQITGKRARWIVDRTWETPGAGVVREAAGTQSDMTYICRQHATVAQWVALRPISKVCAGEKGYKWDGHRREA